MNTQEKKNYMHIRFPALPENEGLARVCVAALASQLDPDMEELSEIRTAGHGSLAQRTGRHSENHQL